MTLFKHALKCLSDAEEECPRLFSWPTLELETVLDTIYTLQAMAADILVMRDAEPGLPAAVAQVVAPHVCILDAGEAHLSHPTQGLLDALTVRQKKEDFGSLRIA